MEWICKIALYMIVSGLILELIADTKYYKFASWVAGVLLLLQFAEPVAELAGVKPQLLSRLTTFDYALGTDKILEEIYQTEYETKQSVLGSFKETVAGQMDTLLRNNGLRLEEAELSVAEDGGLEQICITARYLDGTEEEKRIAIPTVAPVKIGEKQRKTTVSPMEIYIRELLAEFYQVDENRIEVEIREAN